MSSRNLNALAKQLSSMSQAPAGTNASVTPTTSTTGVVTALQLSATPPTITVQISGSTTPVVGVAFMSPYVPVIGDTVSLQKQGTVLWATGAITTTPAAWETPTLASGVTQGGNGNGNLQYRVYSESGAQKVAFQGAITTGGSLSLFTLGTDARPSVHRSVLAGCDAAGGVAVCVDIQTSGLASINVGSVSTDVSSQAPGTNNQSPGTTSVDLNPTGAGGTDGHTHGVAGPHFHTVNSHFHTVNYHSHPFTFSWATPVWVSFDGVSLFL